MQAVRLNPTWTISQGSLPAGLTLSSTGALTGTPTATGDFSFKVTATAGSHSDTQTYSMTVVAPLQLTAKAAAGEVGIAYALAPQTVGGKAGYTYTLEGTLPAGLTFDATTAAISGKPTAAGTSTVKLTATDTLGLTSSCQSAPDDHAASADHEDAARASNSRQEVQRAATAHGRRTSVLVRVSRRAAGPVAQGPEAQCADGCDLRHAQAGGPFWLRLQVNDALGAHSAAGFVLKVKG